MDYAKYASNERTTSDRVDPRQRRNNSGAWVFTLSPLERLERFLVLGAEGGTFYQGERELVRENAGALGELLDASPLDAVRLIVEVSQWGRAPKQGPAIFALAIAASHETGPHALAARKAAIDAIPLVCRTGASLLEFVRYVDSMRGWGSYLRKGVGHWYASKPADALFYQLFKYRSRGAGKGKERKVWTHRDVLRASHPNNRHFDRAQQAIVRYVVAGKEGLGSRSVISKAKDGTLLRSEVQIDLGGVPERIAQFEALQAAETAEEAARLIVDHRLVHEMVPGHLKRHAGVWAALSEHMPMGALVRNLGRLTHFGLLGDRERKQRILDRLGDVAAIKKSRLHPFAFLLAGFAYAHGEPIEAKKYAKKVKKGVVVGEREIQRWTPDPDVGRVVEQGFYKAFVNVEPADVRLELAVDISGSMGSTPVVGMPGMKARHAAAAMALVQRKSEPRSSLWGFCTEYLPLEIESDWSLSKVAAYMSGLQMGGTDISLPFREAQRCGREVDGFVVYTDNETNQSRHHPFLSLKGYRAASGIAARLGVMAFSATDFTIADPSDGGMMDFAGVNAAAPSLLADFLRGKRMARRTGEGLGEAEEEEDEA